MVLTVMLPAGAISLVSYGERPAELYGLGMSSLPVTVAMRMCSGDNGVPHTITYRQTATCKRAWQQAIMTPDYMGSARPQTLKKLPARAAVTLAYFTSAVW